MPWTDVAVKGAPLYAMNWRCSDVRSVSMGGCQTTEPPLHWDQRVMVSPGRITFTLISVVRSTARRNSSGSWSMIGQVP